MRVPQLKLNSGDNSDFTDVPLWTSHLRIPLNGHKPTVKPGQRVAARQCIATHPSLTIGDMHSPAAGSVEEVSPKVIVIAQAPQDRETYSDEEPDGIDFDAVDDADLPRTLKELGIDLGPLLAPCKTMIINAMSPEPAMSWPELLLKDYDDVLEEGLELLRRLRPELTFILAAEKNKKNKEGVKLAELETVALNPYYPNSLPVLVIRAVCAGRGLNPADVCCLSLQQLYDLGMTTVYGLPLTETILSAQMRSRVVNIGTPVRDIITDLEVEMGAGDLVITGGPFQGKVVGDLSHGVGKHVPGVFMLRFQTFAPYSKDPCVNCGGCVRLCPVGLWPNTISRHVEKENFEAAKAAGVDRCIDCGLCSYICVARRPMLQWMKTAKKKLGITPDVKFLAWDPDTQTVSGTYASKSDKRKAAAAKGGPRG